MGSQKILKKRRSVAALLVCLFTFLFGFVVERNDAQQTQPPQDQSDVLSQSTDSLELATNVLDQLEVKGRAAKTGYSRSEFSDGWAQIGSCDVRNLVLARDMTQIELESDGCKVLVGVLVDPYTDTEIIFERGADTSDAVQIDHVVAVSDAWQKGAQALSYEDRFQFYNDSLNLLAVDGSANQAKSASDAASWLPPNKAYRCRFIARQIAVKRKYRLWVTGAEKSAMQRVLNSCKDQPLPIITPVSLLPSEAWDSANLSIIFGLTSPLLASSYSYTSRSATPGRTETGSSVVIGVATKT